MSEITINRSIDVEETIVDMLSNYMTVYCAPLPAKFDTPNILVRWVGGNTISTAKGESKIDTFTVVLDARAETEAEASEYIRNALGILEAICVRQSGGLSRVSVNSLYSWGADPVRPDLAMCSATVFVTAHREEVVITTEV